MGIKKYLVSLLSFLIIITTVMPSVFNSSIIKVDAQGTDRIVDNSKVFDDYKKYEIETISPQGTVINLFDYWYADSKSNDGKKWVDKNINANHELQFYNQQSSPTGERINNWQGHDGHLPLFDMVEPGLDENGYPTLNYREHSGYGIDKNESLDYLFNPIYKDKNGKPQDGKESFVNVSDLLHINENGYFEYKSETNFASYDKTNNKFHVYNKGAVLNDGDVADKTPNNFFPFNTPDQVFDSNGNPKGLSECSEYSEFLNHSFGMSMTTRFIQTKDGKGVNGDPITYKFTGDDDVWVYIDDVLVGDLSGIHDETNLEINFNTGDIEISIDGKGVKPVNTNLRERFEKYNDFYEKSRKMKDLDKIFKKDTNTFADNSYHTLKFFYLERGGYASNLQLTFNMKTIPNTDIYKIDATGKPLAGVDFKLFKTDSNFVVMDESKPLSVGTTDKKGHILFTHYNDNTKVVDFDELHIETGNLQEHDYYVLRETKTLPGYRKSKDIRLTYKLLNTDNARGYLITEKEHSLESGAFASPKVIISAPEIIDVVGYEESVNLGKNGKMYAVILVKCNDNDPNNKDKWMPVSGNPIQGWTLGEPMALNQGQVNDSLIAAINANNYQAKLSGSGAYEVHIDNMPGNLEEYYWVKNASIDNHDLSNVKYTVAFYYWEDKDNENDIEVNEVNRVSNESNNNFERYFSSNIFVSNPQNKLVVQKIDANGATIGDAYKKDSPLNAEFALYKEGNLRKPYDIITINEHSESKGALKMDNIAVFPSDKKKVLENGTYILKEITAPKGYEINPASITIIVNDDGVFADAGVKNDGIHVLNGVGYLFKSLEQFASEDKMDSSLAHIRTYQGIQKSDAVIDGTSKGNPADNSKYDFNYNVDNNPYDPMDNANHLYYAKSHDINEIVYLTYAPTPNTDSKLFWHTDVGFSKIQIMQCSHHRNAEIEKFTEIDNYRDISNVFSNSTVVQVMNQPIIEGSKRLSDKAIDINDKFEFEIKAWNYNENKEIENYENIEVPKNSTIERQTAEINTPINFEFDSFKLKPEFELPEGVNNQKFEYKIREVVESTKNHYIYDKTEYKLSLEINRFISKNGTSSYGMQYNMCKIDEDKKDCTLPKQNSLISADFNNKFVNDFKVTKKVETEDGIVAPDQEFNIKVIFENGDVLSDEKYTYKLYELVDGEEQPVIDSNTNKQITGVHTKDNNVIKLKANQSAVFEKISPNITYEVVEEGLNDNKEIITTNGKFIFDSFRSRDIKGTIGNTVDRTTKEVIVKNVVVLNKYVATTDVDICGVKNIKNRNFLDSDTFTFKIEAIEENVPLPAKQEVTISNLDINTNTKEFKFDKITFNKPGQYKYIVYENVGKISNMIYSKAIFEVTVDVRVDEENKDKLVTTVTHKLLQDESGKQVETVVDQIIFNNISIEDIVFNYTAYKQLNDSTSSLDISKEKFEFEVMPTDLNFNYPKPQGITENNWVVTNTYQEGKNQISIFGKGLIIKNEHVGKSYIYKVKEVIPSTPKVGMTYDETPQYIKITPSLKDNVDIQVEALLCDKNGNPKPSDIIKMTFVNSYEPIEATLNLKGLKDFDKDLNEDDRFNFEFMITPKLSQVLLPLDNASGESTHPFTMSDSNDVPMPMKDGKVNNKATFNKSDKTFTFDTITYKCPGIYNYEITEVNNGIQGVEYDRTVYTLQVEVKDIDGVLQVSYAIDGEMDKPIVFKNTYNPSSDTCSISGTKELLHKDTFIDINDRKFTFQLTDLNNQVIKETTNNNSKFTFDPIELTTVGKHHFKVSEVNENKQGYKYSDLVYDVLIDVIDDNGMLKVDKVTYLLNNQNVDKLKFTNIYDPIASEYEIKAIKLLEGRPLLNGEFTFELINENTKERITATNDDQGNIIFSNLQTPLEETTITYTLKEVKGEDGNITYDDNIYKIVVDVRDDSNGKYVASVQYELNDQNVDQIVFTNKYNEPKPIITPKPDEPKNPESYDGGGPFTTDDCGNIYDRWGNLIWKSDHCKAVVQDEYKIVNTSDK